MLDFNTLVLKLSDPRHPEKASILEKLNSLEFKEFLKERLKNFLPHPLVNQPRIAIPLAAEDDFDYLLDADEDFLDEFGPFPAVKDADFKNYKSKAVPVAVDFVKGQLKTQNKTFPAGVHTPVSKPKVGQSLRFYHDGVLAGGAIAALANEFLTGVPAVINDVDYFYYSNRKFNDLDEMNEQMYENLAETSAGEYKLISSFKEGMLNFIKIAPVEDPEKENFSWKNLLSTFDLNCCMIAVHPLTFDVIINTDFINFLVTRKISHSKNSEFNISNIIRGKRKSQELQATYYVGEEIRNLIINDLKNYNPSFSINSHFISKVTLISKSKNKNNPMFLSTKDKAFIRKNPKFLAPFLSFNKSNNSFTLLQSFPVLTYFNTLKQKKLSSEKDWDLLEKVLKDVNPTFPQEEVSNKFYEKLIFIKEIFTKNQIRVFHPNLYNYHSIDIECLSFLIKENFHEHSFTKLFEKLKGHDVLIEGFFTLLKKGWKFKEIETLFNKILKSSESTGVLEGMFRSTNNEITFEGHSLPFDFKNMRTAAIIRVVEDSIAFKKIARAKINKLREKEDFRYFNSLVRELTTMDELEEEGRKMHHCVGGYSLAVRNGHSRIFHLQVSSTEFSTLELGYESVYTSFLKTDDPPTPSYRIRQNKSFANAYPSPKLERLAQLFTIFLNKNIKKTDIIENNQKN